MSGITVIPDDAKYPPLALELLLPLIVPPAERERYVPCPRRPVVARRLERTEP